MLINQFSVLSNNFRDFWKKYEVIQTQVVIWAFNKYSRQRKYNREVAQTYERNRLSIQYKILFQLTQKKGK